MDPILTPDQMADVDAASGDVAVLIERAGRRVAHHARRMLGGTYGRRVTVIAGSGKNGADGKVAARVLAAWGVRVRTVSPADREIPPSDLVIDAAFGTGLRDRWDAPSVDSPVLAVDLPSGLDPLDGSDRGGLYAELTVTFGAWKPGMLVGNGPARCGHVVVERLGLDLDATTVDTWLWADGDCHDHVPGRELTDHKWAHAVRVLGGSVGMEGAPALTTEAALRAGAGMVVASRPDGGTIRGLPVSAVQAYLRDSWVDAALDGVERFSVVVIGPGVGRDPDTAADVRRFVAACPVALVIDADAIHAIAVDLDCIASRTAATVITPHDGEFAAFGDVASAERLAATRAAAVATGAVVLRKGPATIVADPSGRCAVVSSGDSRLATAGTGDVLAGMIAAMPLDDSWAGVASAAHWHGRAGSLCERFGTVASDVIAKIGPARTMLEHRAHDTGVR